MRFLSDPRLCRWGPPSKEEQLETTKILEKNSLETTKEETTKGTSRNKSSRSSRKKQKQRNKQQQRKQQQVVDSHVALGTDHFSYGLSNFAGDEQQILDHLVVGSQSQGQSQTQSDQHQEKEEKEEKRYDLLKQFLNAALDLCVATQNLSLAIAFEGGHERFDDGHDGAHTHTQQPQKKILEYMRKRQGVMDSFLFVGPGRSRGVTTGRHQHIPVPSFDDGGIVDLAAGHLLEPIDTFFGSTQKTLIDLYLSPAGGSPATWAKCPRSQKKMRKKNELKLPKYFFA